MKYMLIVVHGTRILQPHLTRHAGNPPRTEVMSIGKRITLWVDPFHFHVLSATRVKRASAWRSDQLFKPPRASGAAFFIRRRPRDTLRDRSAPVLGRSNFRPLNLSGYSNFRRASRIAAPEDGCTPPQNVPRVGDRKQVIERIDTSAFLSINYLRLECIPW